ncbi:MAG: hypothetical protein COA79_07755 [Planctomycetota bacterium]|nr:MAG: hypothetical protein COA79_07755 [Planctomycetota bacterium]
MKIGKKLTLSHMLMAITPVVVVGIVISLIVTSKFNELDETANKNGVAVISKKSSDEIMKAAFDKLNAVQQIKKKQILKSFESRKGDLSALVNVLSAQRLETFKKFKAIRESRSSSITRYFQSIINQIQTYSGNEMIVNAMLNFKSEFHKNFSDNEFSRDQLSSMKKDLSNFYMNEFSKQYSAQNKNLISPAAKWLSHISDEAIVMQTPFIAKNPKPLGSKDQLFSIGDNSSFDALHKKIHPIIRNYQQKFGYYDIFLVDIDTGHIVYSVFKELDFGTSLLNGPHASSGIGNVFKKATQLNEKGSYYIDDFKQYGPSYEAPAGFIASPIFDGTKKIGVLIFQMPIDKINNVMKEKSGLGDTGETILVGPDYLMRSDSLLDANHSILNSFKNPAKGKVDTKATRAVFERNESGYVWTKDYRKKDTLIMYGPLKVGNLTWCLNAKVDLEEFFCTAENRKIKDSYFLSKYKKQYGYYDLFLIDPNGNCFYSVEEEADFQTNLVNGKFKDSNLGKLTRQVLETKRFGFADFAPYAPSNGDPAAFIAQPVLGEDGDIQVIIALQLSLDSINDVMMERTGMGKTGETYLVGPDLLMRSNSFLDLTNHSVKASFLNPEKGRVDTEAARLAISGKSGNKIIIDYNGNSVLSSFSPLNVFGNRWGILAEIDEAEAFAINKEINALSKKVGEKIDSSKSHSVELILWVILSLCVISAFLAYFLCKIISNGITKPIIKTVELANAMAKGDMSKTLDITSKDEIGELAVALNKTTHELSAMIHQIQNHSNMLGGSSEELATISTQMVSGSEEMTQQSTNVAGATEQMSTNINTMASAVEEMSTNTGSVSSAAEEMSQNMSSVASAIEEMSTSINGIGKNSKEGKLIAKEAMEMAGLATETMNVLGEAAKEIGQVTETIKSIAEKTDLLALNATIEAASAGEAGKGFAVVANEIKGLANRSAQAAEDIANRIDGVQKNSSDAIEVIEKVSSIINKINESINVITLSVEEQTCTSNEIASNINQADIGVKNIAESIGEIAKGANDISKNAGEAAKGANDVSINIQGVNQAAEESNAGAQQINTSAKELSSIAGELKELVDKFKVNSVESVSYAN